MLRLQAEIGRRDCGIVGRKNQMHLVAQSPAVTWKMPQPGCRKLKKSFKAYRPLRYWFRGDVKAREKSCLCSSNPAAWSASPEFRCSKVIPCRREQPNNEYSPPSYSCPLALLPLASPKAAPLGHAPRFGNTAPSHFPPFSRLLAHSGTIYSRRPNYNYKRRIVITDGHGGTIG